ncbi:hypothetical protein [Nonomuraea sp. SYSU D8015]|uniref:hypothetical protein n=1 Tax=Nonomuraea sp. SYSU D8015 TaxID=2593644 RepID=UPI001660964E|nr:hypothetical protein [Nonomuraea sp. SYSU D8015]
MSCAACSRPLDVANELVGPSGAGKSTLRRQIDVVTQDPSRGRRALARALLSRLLTYGGCYAALVAAQTVYVASP